MDGAGGGKGSRIVVVANDPKTVSEPIRAGPECAKRFAKREAGVASARAEFGKVLVLAVLDMLSFASKDMARGSVTGLTRASPATKLPGDANELAMPLPVVAAALGSNVVPGPIAAAPPPLVV